MNKKAVEINVATIIIVILAILVLVILALYFTGGMKALWSKITPYSGAWDITEVQQARMVCTMYCSAQQKTDFCAYNATISKKDEKGNIIGTDTLKCWHHPINAHREQECIRAGFNEQACEKEE